MFAGMTLWDFNRLVETHLPWWAPAAAPMVVAVVACVVLMWRAYGR